jgi:hypothetical protein
MRESVTFHLGKRVVIVHNNFFLSLGKKIKRRKDLLFHILFGIVIIFGVIGDYFDKIKYHELFLGLSIIGILVQWIRISGVIFYAAILIICAVISTFIALFDHSLFLFTEVVSIWIFLLMIILLFCVIYEHVKKEIL